MFGTLKAMFGGGSEAVAEALKNGAVIIDVRSPAEFQGGHVAGSKNIPLNEIGSRLGSFEAGVPIVFCCASGARSGTAASQAKSNGFDAHNGGPWTNVNRMVAEG